MLSNVELVRTPNARGVGNRNASSFITSSLVDYYRCIQRQGFTADYI